jgi:succinate-semialdehyde dehydrogenase/glutarate-semialdehyde dehydrogenase
MTAYEKLELYIDGQFCQGSTGKSQDVPNPATYRSLGKVPHASKEDLDRALAAADRAWLAWRKVSPFERSKLLRKAADLIRTRSEAIASTLTQEQGKPIVEARQEVNGSADILDWFAEEGRRAYGRIIPARLDGVRQMVMMEPVGPVAGFAPWNFPVSQMLKKIAPALAAGCTIIIKCPEETPGSSVAVIRCLHDAGIPPGVVNLVFGVPSDISTHLIPSPVIRKVSFTGSVPVGKHLAEMAGRHMKRVTMELGGHAPVIIFDDADAEHAAKLTAGAKYRNAGQVCISPTRFFVHEKVYDKFVGTFTDVAKGLKVGNGLEADTRMGPLANPRRIDAIEAFVGDAVDHGGKVAAGGKRIGNEGNFYQPTVLTDVPEDARIMNEEPFAPVAVMTRFKDFDEAVRRANRLPFGLAGYAYTRSAKTATAIAEALDTGMVSVNHHGLALPETPFGGVKDSGYGHEGGTEGLAPFLVAKFVTQAGI